MFCYMILVPICLWYVLWWFDRVPLWLHYEGICKQHKLPVKSHHDNNAGWWLADGIHITWFEVYKRAVLVLGGLPRVWVALYLFVLWCGIGCGTWLPTHTPDITGRRIPYQWIVVVSVSCISGKNTETATGRSDLSSTWSVKSARWGAVLGNSQVSVEHVDDPRLSTVWFPVSSHWV